MNTSLLQTILDSFDVQSDDHFSVGGMSPFKDINPQDYIFEIPGDNRKFYQGVCASSKDITKAFEEIQFDLKHVTHIKVAQYRKDENKRNQCIKTLFFKY